MVYLYDLIHKKMKEVNKNPKELEISDGELSEVTNKFRIKKIQMIKAIDDMNKHGYKIKLKKRWG